MEKGNKDGKWKMENGRFIQRSFSGDGWKMEFVNEVKDYIFDK